MTPIKELDEQARAILKGNDRGAPVSRCSTRAEIRP